MDGQGYATGQLQAAFVTALTDADPATRERADARVERWLEVLRNTASGAVKVGSRRPVHGLPVWVTPVIMRGGFATGEAAAARPLEADEIRWAERAGVRPDRGALFRHALTPAGTATLHELLDSGRYRATVPEETALLTVAWLRRAGDRAAADHVVEVLAPLSTRLRFLPRPASTRALPPDLVARATVGDVLGDLGRRTVPPRIASMRTSLAQWLPLRDELLAHWRRTIVDGRVGAVLDDGWRADSVALLHRHDALAARTGRARRWSNDNLGVMVRVLRAVLDGSPGARELGLLQHRVDRMIAAEGPRLADVRVEQARVAALPTHRTLAVVAADRLARYDPMQGIPHPDDVLGPVTSDDAPATPDHEPPEHVPAGTPLPASVRRIVRRAHQQTVTELAAVGSIPSVAVLAGLTPRLTAAAVARAVADPAGQALLATALAAFGARRSVLLTDLAAQVRADEVPWIAALQNHRAPDAPTPARAALRSLGELTVTTFPATPVPNEMVEQLRVLATQAGDDLPLVAELAADIFTGEFSVRYVRAAELAADLLEGTLYARYYDLSPLPAGAGELARQEFARRCHERAGVARPTRSVAQNGAVIEQAQILTSHNLALLAGPVGVRADWYDAAGRALDDVALRLRSATTAPDMRGALRAIGSAAGSWRQMVFHLSAAGSGAAARLAAERPYDAGSEVDRCVERLLAELVACEADDACRTPFVGWATDDEHPVLDALTATRR